MSVSVFSSCQYLFFSSVNIFTCLPLLVHTFIGPLCLSSIYLAIHLLMALSKPSTHLFMLSFFCLSHQIIQSFIHPCLPCLVLSTHPFIHSSNHPPIHSSFYCPTMYLSTYQMQYKNNFSKEVHIRIS